ncbi:MAG: TRAP transporter small permease [Sneathiella sp.]
MTHSFKKLDRGLRLLTQLSFQIGAIALAGMVTLYVYEVFVRYALNAPTTWTLEVVGYLLCVMIFMTAPEVTRKGSHIVIDILIANLPSSKANIVFKGLTIVSAIVCLFTAYIAANETITQFTRGVMTNAGHPIPKGLVSIFIAYGVGVCGLLFLRQAIERTRLQPLQGESDNEKEGVLN